MKGWAWDVRSVEKVGRGEEVCRQVRVTILLIALGDMEGRYSLQEKAVERREGRC